MTVLDDASFVERERGLISLTDLSPSWLIFSDGFSAGPLTDFVKRAVDLVMALLLLPLVVAVPAADRAVDPARYALVPSSTDRSGSAWADGLSRS